jgi:Chaperone of endosialidase
MNDPIIQLTDTIPSIRNLFSLSPLRRGFVLIPLALVSFALSPAARAVTPAPDGGYPKNNTAEGDNALLNLTKGTDNTAVGFQSLFGNTNGSRNTAVGSDTLSRNTSGVSNVAIGEGALFDNVNGNGNIGIGFGALGSNTASDNTAVGSGAMNSNSSGADNVALGSGALLDNNANENTGVGARALQNTTSGPYNTAIGFQALYGNSQGDFNTATGYQALLNNTFGGSNTADGAGALSNNNTGGFNIALGDQAGINLTTGSNNIDIGNPGKAAEANTIRIGTKGTQTAAFVAGVYGTPVTGSQVIVNSNGRLGVATSSARFKEAIKPMDSASEAILALKPVTFHYKEEVDPDATPQFGLVAEQVEKVSPDLVIHDEEGKPFTVRYEAVNAMLLNEFLKEYGKAQAEERKVESLEATVAKQQKQIEALTAGLQRVTTQVQVTKPAERTAANDQ